MSSLITHEQTDISRQNRDIESNLVEKLNGYLNLLRSVLDNSRAKWMDFRVILEPRFRPIVEQTIREAATLSYQLGSAYTADKAGLPFFLTTTDIQNIKQLTDEFTNKFFGRIQLSIDNTNYAQYSITETAIPESNLNPNYIATSVAIGVTSKSLALGSTLKAKSIVSNGRAGRMGLLQAADPKKRRKNKNKKSAAEIALAEIQAEIDAAIEEGEPDLMSIITNLGGSALIGIGISELLRQEFVWVAQPGRCEQYCAPLEGQTFDVLDPNIPVPIQDTHPSCRCRLLLA
jgi:hypothetical protein